MTEETEIYDFPEFVLDGDHYFRPTDTATNVNAMRKEATKRAVAGKMATIHHHGVNSLCRVDFVHEYFGYGPHSKCDGQGCSGCDNGWKKH